MNLAPKKDAVADISSAQLREYLDTHKSGEYVIVDVRQPEEYAQAHIPGAKLMPLSDLNESTMRQLPTDAMKIFYCRSGGRSGRASQLAVEAASLQNVFNLVGGIGGWQGEAVADFPNVRVFLHTGDLSSVLSRAMELEKGAERLYGVLSERLGNTPVATILQSLSKAEMAHARSIYRVLEQAGARPAEPFERLYASLRDDLVESGETLETVVDRALAVESLGSIALLELALDMEYKALDLYTAVAEGETHESIRSILSDLAAQERRHADQLLKGIGMLAEAQ